MDRTPRKITTELLSLTYGALVSQLVRDFEEDFVKVNDKLEAMGVSIGNRLVDEVLAKSGARRCGSFREAMGNLVHVAFKMYFGGTCVPRLTLANDGNSASIQFLVEAPWEEFVQLPEDYARGGLRYSNVLAGVIKGAMEAILIKVKVVFLKDRLLGDDLTELRVELVETMKETAGEDYRED